MSWYLRGVSGCVPGLPAKGGALGGSGPGALSPKPEGTVWSG